MGDESIIAFFFSQMVMINYLRQKLDVNNPEPRD